MNGFGLGAVHIQMHRIQHMQVVFGSLHLRKLLERLEKQSVKRFCGSALRTATQDVILLDDGLVHELKINIQLHIRCAVVVPHQHALPHDPLKLMVLARHYLS
jgi:hypothetical protein